MKLDLPSPVDPATLGAMLPGVAPAGTKVSAKRKGWLLRQGNRILLVKPEKNGTRLRFTMQTPGWAYAFILLGLIPFIIAVFVFDAAVKSFATDVRTRLAGALGVPGYLPNPLSPCPACAKLVPVVVDHAGLRYCPLCANTGQPLPAPLVGTP